MSYQIIQNVSLYDVKELFKKMDRDYFSLDALEYILDEQEEINEGNPFDLDVIAICCDYSEYDDMESLVDYLDRSPWFDRDEVVDDCGDVDGDLLVEVCNDYITVIELPNGHYLVTNE